MAVNKRFLAPVDIGLIVGIMVLSAGGIAYAALSGVVTIPGIKPLLKADLPILAPSTVAQPSTVSVHSPRSIESISPSPAPAASPAIAPIAASPTPAPLPTASPAAAVSPSPAASPSLSPSPSPTVNPKTVRDDDRKKALADLKAALNLYYNKTKKYPIATTFTEGRTDSPTTSLKSLIDSSYIDRLPTDSTPGYWYGYRSNDGQDCELTAQLEDKNDPAGQYTTEKAPVYLYTATCR